MKHLGLLLWGLIGTLTLTGLMAAGRGLHLTRVSLPFLTGTVFTPDRRRADRLGLAMHLVNGWILALLYAALFRRLHTATVWLGATLGFFHGLFVLVALFPLLPSMHPRMATEQYGPTPTRQLAPPGFMGLNYGRRTPLAVLFAHTIYGAVLGGLYHIT